MARFPHEFTMKKYHLIEADLNEDANEALQDFENFLSHLTDLKSKAGDAWGMTQDQQKKLNRLSRAVCMEIEYMVEEVPDEPVLEVPTKPVLEVPTKPVLEVPAKEKKEKKEKPTTSQAGESPFNIFRF
jgi:hypothetical protein